MPAVADMICVCQGDNSNKKLRLQQMMASRGAIDGRGQL